jgi:hypothetical protein
MAFGKKKAVPTPEPAKKAKKAAKPAKKRVPFDPGLKIAGKASAAQLRARIAFLEDQVKFHEGRKGRRGR